jgi:hypothetical protein
MLLSSWLQTPSIPKVGFDDVLVAIKAPETYVLINTLPLTRQDCLIQRSVVASDEEALMNDLLNRYKHHTTHIVVYGTHASDTTVETKYHQLRALGFAHVYVYAGGMFEWMLLQDIYGHDEFPTTSRTRDILRFQPTGVFRVPRLTDGR